MTTSQHVIIPTHQSVSRASVYLASGSRRGIALLSTSGGVCEPSGAFEELALYCQSAGITALRFQLRAPRLFVPTVLDLRSVVAAMTERDVDQVVLIVEAATRRAAAFAPIAYRSVVGLVERVVGVATILPLGAEPQERLPQTLPADLLFLLRSARSLPDGLVAQREIVRADGRTELFLAPGRLRTSADGLKAIVAPTFSWAQRTLQYPLPVEDSAPGLELDPRGITVADPVSLPPGDAPVAQDRGWMSLSDRAMSEVSPSLRAVWTWLVDEWRRICAEQAERDPLHEAPHSLTLPARMERLSAHALLQWFSGQRSHLDRTAQAEWIAAYVRASHMVTQMTATGAATRLPKDKACGA